MDDYCASLEKCPLSLELCKSHINARVQHSFANLHMGEFFFRQVWIEDRSHAIYNYLLGCLPMTLGVGIVVVH